MPNARPPADRFWAKVIRRGPDECWKWTGWLSRGYGGFYIGGVVRHVGAHRFAYELLVGPIPDGMDLDHTCHNDSGCPGGDSCAHRACVNPAHLEPVTRRENLSRGVRPVYWALKTHCPQGHEYTPANTYRSPGGRRYCRACQVERRRARGLRSWADKRAAKTHCVNGHELTPDNARHKPNGGIACRICARESTRRNRARKRAATRSSS